MAGQTFSQTADAPGPSPPAAGTRDQGIDSLRFLLCFAVALLHTMPRADVGAPPDWVLLAASICRGAVPFFFVASGFFARVPDRFDRRFFARPLRRLLPVYLAWMAVYYAIAVAQAGAVPRIKPFDLVTGGVAFHLWFLPALAFAMIFVPLMLARAGRAATWLACIAIAALNLAFVAYRDVLRLPDIPGTRAMIAPLLFLLGMDLAPRLRRPALPAALAITIGAWLLTIGEEAAIAHLSDGHAVSHSSVMSTYLLGLAVFVLARSLDGYGLAALLNPLGRISLGIYASHVVFVKIFVGTFGTETLGRSLASALATIACATALCLVLKRFSVTRRFVA